MEEEETVEDITDKLFAKIANAEEFHKEVDAASLRQLFENKVFLKALAYILIEADAKAMVLMGMDLDNVDSLKEAKAVQMEAKSLTRSVEILVGLATKDGEV